MQYIFFAGGNKTCSIKGVIINIFGSKRPNIPRLLDPVIFKINLKISESFYCEINNISNLTY